MTELGKKIISLREKGMSMREICKELECSMGAVSYNCKKLDMNCPLGKSKISKACQKGREDHGFKVWADNAKRTISESSYVDGDRSNKSTKIRQHARSIMRMLKSDCRCSRCNFPHYVEVCHIHPVSSFSPDTPLSVVNSPLNLICLCPNCHKLHDKNPKEFEKEPEYKFRT